MTPERPPPPPQLVALPPQPAAASRDQASVRVLCLHCIRGRSAPPNYSYSEWPWRKLGGLEAHLHGVPGTEAASALDFGRRQLEAPQAAWSALLAEPVWVKAAVLDNCEDHLAEGLRRAFAGPTPSPPSCSSAPTPEVAPHPASLFDDSLHPEYCAMVGCEVRCGACLRFEKLQHRGRGRWSDRSYCAACWATWLGSWSVRH